MVSYFVTLADLELRMIYLPVSPKELTLMACTTILARAILLVSGSIIGENRTTYYQNYVFLVNS